MWPQIEKGTSKMQRKSTAALCLILTVIVLACSRNGVLPQRLPGKAFEMDSIDPENSELLDGQLAKDREPHPRRRSCEFPSPARCLRARRRPRLHTPAARRSRRRRFRARVLDGQDDRRANPGSFRVPNADFECSADDQRAYYRQTVSAGADPRTFPPDRAVTNCWDTPISLAE